MIRTIAVITLIAVAAPTAAESPRAEAKRRFAQAQEHYRLGRFEEALGDYTRAYELANLPELLFNIAQCHRNLGDYERAVFFFQRFLKEAPNIKDRARVEELVASLEEKIAAERAAEAEPAQEEEFELEPEAAAPPRAAPPEVVATPPPAAGDDDGVLGKWWFWTVIGAAVAAGVGGAVAVAASGQDAPSGSIATFDFR